jgi:hypothetical protein
MTKQQKMEAEGHAIFYFIVIEMEKELNKMIPKLLNILKNRLKRNTQMLNLNLVIFIILGLERKKI